MCGDFIRTCGHCVGRVGVNINRIYYRIFSKVLFLSLCSNPLALRTVLCKYILEALGKTVAIWVFETYQNKYPAYRKLPPIKSRLTNKQLCVFDNFWFQVTAWLVHLTVPYQVYNCVGGYQMRNELTGMKYHNVFIVRNAIQKLLLIR